MWGGSKLRPEVAEVMRKTADVMVDLGELNRAAGKVLAEICGAEAGVVVSGSGGGLVMQAAAVIAGKEPAQHGASTRHDGDEGRDHHSQESPVRL